MFTEEDNEHLTRVGPGTLMGDLMRRFWMPILLPEELPHPDCPPVRVRILGENLIAFKDTILAYSLYYPAVDFLSSVAIAQLRRSVSGLQRSAATAPRALRSELGRVA